MPYIPNRINAQSGIYTCQSCGKKTRETGEGESSYQLCAQCNHEALMENSIIDGNQKCTCGNTDDFTVAYPDTHLVCNKCGATGEGENWKAPEAQKTPTTPDAKKQRKAERRKARRAAKKAAQE